MLRPSSPRSVSSCIQGSGEAWLLRSTACCFNCSWSCAGKLNSSCLVAPAVKPAGHHTKLRQCTGDFCKALAQLSTRAIRATIVPSSSTTTRAGSASPLVSELVSPPVATLVSRTRSWDTACSPQSTTERQQRTGNVQMHKSHTGDTSTRLYGSTERQGGWLI